MKHFFNLRSIYILFFLLIQNATLFPQGVIIDHTCTDITKIPAQAITIAKNTLHISYGHTSHGSQITTGMNGLVVFAYNGGKGMTHPQNFFAWNNGGTNGALDMIDGGVLAGDVGYYPDWVNYTRSLLTNTQYSHINVIMWSWCGQVTGKYTSGTLNSEYLDPMNQLETDYPNVKFVYMTGHVDYGTDAANKAANEAIRNYCRANNKILYDFADIERYNPDGNYFEFTSDACDYYSANGTRIGNWAEEWQASHTEGIDWYNCSSAHSMPLNANQKAYAVWWLFARLAGWSGTVAIDNRNDIPVNYNLMQNYPNPFNPVTTIKYTVAETQNFASQQVIIKVYDFLGREIATLVDGVKSPGIHSVQFEARNLTSGIYFYKLQAGKYISAKKMVLIK